MKIFNYWQETFIADTYPFYNNIDFLLELIDYNFKESFKCLQEYSYEDIVKEIKCILYDYSELIEEHKLYINNKKLWKKKYMQ
jgi:hypothetical protein